MGSLLPVNIPPGILGAPGVRRRCQKERRASPAEEIGYPLSMNVRSGRLPGLLLFCLLVVGGGLVIGMITAPDEWYAALNKPFFTPPGWVFGPAWTLLYILIAIAGWRLWRRAHSSRAMQLWWVQLGLNFTWSPIFFSAHLIGLALVIVLLLLVTIVGFIALSWRRARVASLLFVPYAAWVAFASVLNGAIWLLN